MGLFRRKGDAAELELMRAEIASLRESVDQQGSWVLALEGRLNALTASPPVHEECAGIGELRHGQVRLAGEQARYQIAFREDLAVLADRLTRRA